MGAIQVAAGPGVVRAGPALQADVDPVDVGELHARAVGADAEIQNWKLSDVVGAKVGTVDRTKSE
ncbi:hypothetical protein [Streptomyces sp. NPDC004250]|uniref:hypothetical protein n=1 Tax=Streptomyces sp. NPDC004250 TaxID=3364692 RepID=UPI0036C0770D